MCENETSQIMLSDVDSESNFKSDQRCCWIIRNKNKKSIEDILSISDVAFNFHENILMSFDAESNARCVSVQRLLLTTLLLGSDVDFARHFITFISSLYLSHKSKAAALFFHAKSFN